MKRITKYLLTLVAALLFFSSTQAQKQTPPEGGTPKDFKLPERDNNKLSNGLTATLVQYGLIPKVDINVIVKTGNIHEDESEVWLADLTGDLMNEGTTSADFQTIAKKVAAMGGEVNVSTGPHQTYRRHTPRFYERRSSQNKNPSPSRWCTNPAFPRWEILCRMHGLYK